MKRYIPIIMLSVAPVAALACEQHRDVVYQYSTFDALVHRVFDGELTVGELKKRGDFGLGTYNGIDGEMVALGGVYYHTRADGQVVTAADNAKIPFATVTFFDADTILKAPKNADMAVLAAVLDKATSTAPNDFYAIRIAGTFTHMKVRAPRAQKKPYPSMKEVIDTQAVFEAKDVEGTMVGFKAPAFAKGLNVPGYHFHFISTDGKTGGHVLALGVGKAEIALDRSSNWEMQSPENKAFQRTDFSADKSADVKAAVGGK